MKKRWKGFDKTFTCFITALAIIIATLVPSVTAKASESVGDFVNRCYEVTLNRQADETGYNDWVNRLVSGESDGATVAYGFVFSQEYTNQNKDNAAFVTDMYHLFMGRDADEVGFNDWVGQLNNGTDRINVFAGFANSVEFDNICTSYGVRRGTYNVSGPTINPGIKAFVNRCYQIALGRNADNDGFNNWTNALASGSIDGASCAYGFVFSDEYIMSGKSNSAFVNDMYHLFMGRDADEAGFNDWKSQLDNGTSRANVFYGFVMSVEFEEICNSYGVNRGSYTVTESDVERFNNAPVGAEEAVVENTTTTEEVVPATTPVVTPTTPTTTNTTSTQTTTPTTKPADTTPAPNAAPAPTPVVEQPTTNPTTPTTITRCEHNHNELVIPVVYHAYTIHTDRNFYNSSNDVHAYFKCCDCGMESQNAVDWHTSHIDWSNIFSAKDCSDYCELVGTETIEEEPEPEPEPEVVAYINAHNYGDSTDVARYNDRNKEFTLPEDAVIVDFDENYEGLTCAEYLYKYRNCYLRYVCTEGRVRGNGYGHYDGWVPTYAFDVKDQYQVGETYLSGSEIMARYSYYSYIRPYIAENDTSENYGAILSNNEIITQRNIATQ